MTIVPAVPKSGIAQQRRDDVVILRVLGHFDDALADDLREAALEAHAPVILDLGTCVHLDASAVRRVASAWQLYRPEMCLVCPDAGDRRMIQAASVGSDVLVFADVEQALSARGPGRLGWSPPGAA